MTEAAHLMGSASVTSSVEMPPTDWLLHWYRQYAAHLSARRHCS